MKLKLIIVLFLFFISQDHLLAKETNPEIKPKGAVCLLKDDSGDILLVQSYLTKKLSLPGGYIGKKENLVEAAIRETYEETGIVVKVIEPLSVDKNRVIFSCQSIDEIPYYKPNSFNMFKSKIVISLSAPHYGKEVMNVYLSKLSDDILTLYRYQSDVKLLTNLVSKVPSSSSLLHEKPKEIIGQEIYDKQFYLINRLQMFFGNGYVATLFFKACSFFGQHGFSLSLFIISLLILPRRYGLLLGFSILISVYSVAVLKAFFEIPRPFYLLPNLQRMEASGFSFPSGNTTLAGVIVGLALAYLKEMRLINLVPAAFSWIVITSLVGISRVWMGVHYPVDVFSGLLLGGAILTLSLKLWRDNQAKLESRCLWGSLTVIYAFAAWYVMQPAFLYLWFATLGIFFSTFFFKKENYSAFNNERCFWGYSTISISGLLLLLTPVFLLDSATTSLLHLAVKGGAVLLSMFWMFSLAPVVYVRIVGVLK